MYTQIFIAIAALSVASASIIPHVVVGAPGVVIKGPSAQSAATGPDGSAIAAAVDGGVVAVAPVPGVVAVAPPALVHGGAILAGPSGTVVTNGGVAAIPAVVAGHGLWGW